MWRVLAILALVALATPGQAQRGMRAAPMGRPGPVFRGAPAPRFAPMPRFGPMPRGPMVRFAPGARVFGRGFGPSGFAFGHIGHGGVRFRTVPFCDPRFISCQFQFSRFGFSPFFSPFGFGGFGFGGFGGYPFYGGYYGGYPLFSDSSQPDYTQGAAQPALQPIVIYAQPPPQQPAPPPEPAPQPQAAPGKQPEPMSLPATVLVFRDQHREEVTNYAIAGDTLFVFLAGGRKKIALSDLDLPATIKVNDDRGVEFHIPSQARKGS